MIKDGVKNKLSDSFFNEPEVEQKVEQPVAEQPKPVKAEEPVEVEKDNVFKVMSEEDAYIADRMKSQPKSLDEIVTVKEDKIAPTEHRLSLPKELEKHKDKFAFRWINKKKRAIDEAIIKGWILVNRTLMPDVAKEAKHLFSTSGAIEKGDAILALMPAQKAQAIRRAPGEKSTDYIKSHLSKGKQQLGKGVSGFYQPEDEGEATDGLLEGRDF